MPPSLPSAPEMLAAVGDYLETQILPGLRDEQRFNLRISLNLLAMIERELRLGPQARAEEGARLSELTGRSGTLEELNRMLAHLIRAGAIAIDDRRLLDHL